MRMKNLLIACAMAFLLVGWGVTTEILAGEREVKERQSPSRQGTEGAGAEHFIFQSLGSAEALDVYSVTSSHANAKCVVADVADEGPFFDTDFYVIVVGRTGSGLAGKAAHRHSGAGGVSPFACRCRSGVGPLSAYVIIGETNHAGAEDYSTIIDVRATSCIGGAVAHSVSLTQNQ